LGSAGAFGRFWPHCQMRNQKFMSYINVVWLELPLALCVLCWHANVDNFMRFRVGSGDPPEAPSLNPLNVPRVVVSGEEAI